MGKTMKGRALFSLSHIRVYSPTGIYSCKIWVSPSPAPV